MRVRFDLYAEFIIYISKDKLVYFRFRIYLFIAAIDL